MKKSYTFKLLITLIVVAFSVIAAHLILKFLSVEVYNEQNGFVYELSSRFDMNDENSVPQWVTQTLSLCIGASAFLAAYLSKEKIKRRLWGAISVVGLLLSVDDAATIHEFILQSVHNALFRDEAPTLLKNSWLVVMPVLLVVGIWLFVNVVKALPRRTALLIILATIIFLTGATGADSLANTIPQRNFLNQGVLGAVEGGLQVIGLSVFLFAIADYLKRFHGQAIDEARKKLRAGRS